METREKSLCESCSNRVVIKFHGEKIKPGIDGRECFYDFKVWAEAPDEWKNVYSSEYYSGYRHVANIIVDECSFYNKSLIPFKRVKPKPEENNDSDDSSNNKSDFRNGVTIVNIPGALLP